MRAASLALACAVILGGGCRRGTYVHLRIEPGDVTSAIAELRLQLRLADAMDAVVLHEPGGGPIALPTDATIDIRSGDGALGVEVQGLDEQGDPAAHGSASGTVRRGDTLELSLVLTRGEDVQLTVTKEHEASNQSPPLLVADGDLTSSPPGIACTGDTCAVGVPRGQSVTLTAVLGASSGGVAWTGCTSSSGLTCTLDPPPGAGSATVTVRYLLSTHTYTLQPGAGGVITYPGGACTSMAGCAVSVREGDSITLQASAAAQTPLASFDGWRSGPCAGAPPGSMIDRCVIASVDGDQTVAAGFVFHNYMFVTSTTYADANFGAYDPNTGGDPNLHGYRGADKKCQDAADAAGIGTTIGRHYKAWLASDVNLPGSGAAAVNAYTRLLTASMTQARGWIRVDGKPFADDLSTAKILSRPFVDELGGTIDGHTYVITGAHGDGNPEAANESCTAWTSASASGAGMAGQAGVGGEFFSRTQASSCNTPTRLYCFGTDLAGVMRIPQPAGTPGVDYKRVFTTTGTWQPTGGLAQADVFCQGEARTAGLCPTTGACTFVAYLPTSTSPASSRATSGLPVYRPDGIQAAATTDKLHAGDFSDAGLDVTATGAWAGGQYLHGGHNPTLSEPTNNCGDWTGTGNEWAGQAPDYLDLGWFGNIGTVGCSPFAMYCIEP